MAPPTKRSDGKRKCTKCGAIKKIGEKCEVCVFIKENKGKI